MLMLHICRAADRQANMLDQLQGYDYDPNAPHEDLEYPDDSVSQIDHTDDEHYREAGELLLGYSVRLISAEVANVSVVQAPASHVSVEGHRGQRCPHVCPLSRPALDQISCMTTSALWSGTLVCSCHQLLKQA